MVIKKKDNKVCTEINPIKDAQNVYSKTSGIVYQIQDIFVND